MGMRIVIFLLVVIILILVGFPFVMVFAIGVGIAVVLWIVAATADSIKNSDFYAKERADIRDAIAELPKIASSIASDKRDQAERGYTFWYVVFSLFILVVFLWPLALIVSIFLDADAVIVGDVTFIPCIILFTCIWAYNVWLPRKYFKPLYKENTTYTSFESILGIVTIVVVISIIVGIILLAY